jgi:aryl-alcohol dehydrogenase-like predicted oxidoreductase
MAGTIPRTELHSGYSISRIIKGGWQLAGGHGPVDRDQAIQDMEAFVSAGITTFDCADIYIGVEELIGVFIRRSRSAFISGSLPRVQIHTKYVPDLDDLPHLGRADVEAVIDRSLKRLGVERLDLVQFHWWDYSIQGYVEAALHLQQLQQQGKIRHVGVTNFDGAHLQEILEAGVPIVSNQVQYSLLDHRPEEDLLPLAETSGLHLLCYGVIAGGFLSERWSGVDLPEQLENRSLVKYALMIEELGGFGLFQELLAVLEPIAQRLGVGIAELAAAYTLQKPRVAAVIVGARNRRHLARMSRITSLRLEPADLEAIGSVTARMPGPRGPVYDLERDRYGKHGRIMKYNLNRQGR